ncbi:MAG: protein tyrosine phosphatase family protein [Proteobacteria bacterium]|nr:protein tyrosine phosphatase family protein [Pseudomonadota bacterium]
MIEIESIYNFLQVESSLSTSGQPSEAQLSALAEKGYDVIINLALHNDPRYSLYDETGLVESLGMTYIHIPVQFDAPTEKDLDSFFNAMKSLENKKVHIHCAANMRVTAFLGLYYLIKQKKSKEEAFDPMHSIWEPDDVWSSFISSVLAKHTS